MTVQERALLVNIDSTIPNHFYPGGYTEKQRNKAWSVLKSMAKCRMVTAEWIDNPRTGSTNLRCLRYIKEGSQ